MIITWMNYRDNKKVIPFDYPPSQTIPDQSLSINEIIDRFSRGQNLTIGHEVYFDGTDDEVDFDNTEPSFSGDYDLADATEQLRVIDINNRQADENKLAKGKQNGKGKPKAVKRSSAADEPEGEGEADDVTLNREAVVE